MQNNYLSSCIHLICVDKLEDIKSSGPALQCRSVSRVPVELSALLPTYMGDELSPPHARK